MRRASSLYSAAVALLTPAFVFAAEPAPAGRAVSVAGKVLIRNESGKLATAVREMKAGDPVYPGDVVNTRSDATVKILMTDKSIIDLGASTLFKVDDYQLKHGSDRKVEMSMAYGKVRASVNTPVGPNGKYTVKTKAATMGVRGTEFIVSSDVNDVPSEKGSGNGKGPDRHDVKTQITVVHGTVEVRDATGASKKPIAVTTGKQLTTFASLVGENTIQRSPTSEGPKMVDVSAPQMKAIVADAKLQDETFKQAVVIDTGSKNGNSSQGAATLASLMGSASPPPSQGFGSKPGDLGLPGTFSPSVTQVPVNALPIGTPVNLTVTFVRK